LRRANEANCTCARKRRDAKKGLRLNQIHISRRLQPDGLRGATLCDTWVFSLK
jgi:hypothetical protein